MPHQPAETDIYFAPDRDAWRNWLETYHMTKKQVWLVQYRKSNPGSCVGYEDAVQEALCYGWIDSKPRKRDDHSYLLFFSKRKPNSVWSASNKKRVEVLLKNGLIKPAGLASIEVARTNGSWSRIDDAEAIVMPPDLAEALSLNKRAADFFAQFPPSAKRGIYTWISIARTEITRKNRIDETVRLAAQNVRANQWQPKK